MIGRELPGDTNWQEVVIEQFETSVDTEAFEAVVERHKFRDHTVVQVEALSVPHAVLPPAMTAMYAFPGRMELRDFGAHLSRILPVRDEDGHIASHSTTKDEQWALTARFTANEQAYSLTSTPAETTMHTTGLQGQDMNCSFSPDTMARFLTSLIGMQMKLKPEVFMGLQKLDYSGDAEVLQRLLLTMGSASPRAASNRERRVWLPQAQHMRALIIKFFEIESSSNSGRRLSYRLAWKPEEILASDVGAFQTEFTSSDQPPVFFSTRSGLDIEPHQLLESQDLDDAADAFNVGAYFDPDLNRAEHASVVATIKPVLDMYLARYAHLDAEALQAIIEPDNT